MPQTRETQARLESLDTSAGPRATEVLDSLDRDTPRHTQWCAERTMPNQVLAYVKNAENSTTTWLLTKADTKRFCPAPIQNTARFTNVRTPRNTLYKLYTPPNLSTLYKL